MKHQTSITNEEKPTTKGSEKTKTKNDELAKLKAEILDVVNKKQKRKKRLRWGSIPVALVLITLSLLAIGQTVQSATILKKINSGDFGSAKSGSSALPSNLESLPNMVGGC